MVTVFRLTGEIICVYGKQSQNMGFRNVTIYYLIQCHLITIMPLLTIFFCSSKWPDRLTHNSGLDVCVGVVLVFGFIFPLYLCFTNLSLWSTPRHLKQTFNKWGFFAFPTYLGFINGTVLMYMLTLGYVQTLSTQIQLSIPLLQRHFCCATSSC